MTFFDGLLLGLIGTTLTVVGFVVALYIGSRSVKTEDPYKDVPEAIKKTIKEYDTRRP